MCWRTDPRRAGAIENQPAPAIVWVCVGGSAHHPCPAACPRSPPRSTLRLAVSQGVVRWRWAGSPPPRRWQGRQLSAGLGLCHQRVSPPPPPASLPAPGQHPADHPGLSLWQGVHPSLPRSLPQAGPCGGPRPGPPVPLSPLEGAAAAPAPAALGSPPPVQSYPRIKGHFASQAASPSLCGSCWAEGGPCAGPGGHSRSSHVDPREALQELPRGQWENRGEEWTGATVGHTAFQNKASRWAGGAPVHLCGETPSGCHLLSICPTLPSSQGDKPLRMPRGPGSLCRH